MIIKHPETGDLSALTALWVQAFGDTEAFINTFFTTGFSEMRCLMAEEKGDLLAALYWFDCSWEGKKIAYLYAIATDENHRGKGICTKLMAHTHEVLKTQGYTGAILVPAEESLEQFYGKMGYQSIATRESSTEQLKKNHAFEKISPEEYLSLRQQYLPRGGVQHTLPAMAYLGMFANFYRFPKGICCGDPTLPMEHLPGYVGDPAMYLPLDGTRELPSYFALSLA